MASKNMKQEIRQDNLYESMPEKELFLKIKDDLLHSRTGIKLEEQVAGGDPDKFLSEINRYIDRVYRVSEEKKSRFVSYIKKYIFGFHVLTEVMEEDGISDIKVLAWNNVRVKRMGKRVGTDISFWSPEDFRGFVEMIAVKNGINIGNVNAIQTFTDKKSSKKFIYRFDISTDTINSTEEPYLHVRKVPKTKLSLKDLIHSGMLDAKTAAYINRRKAEGYMIISGKNGSGKTYLLNALLDEIPPEHSVLVVQENEELSSSKHPDMMFQHIAVRRGDKKINFSLKELVINGLLTDIDYVVIGEIKGGEALYFLNAALAGCLGMTTIHSMNASGALDMLVNYSKWESDYSREELMKLLACVKTVIYVEGFKVQEIVECGGWDGTEKVLQMKTAYNRKKGVEIL